MAGFAEKLKVLEDAGADVREGKVLLTFRNGKGFFFDPAVPEFFTEEEAVAFAKRYIQSKSRRILENRVYGYRLRFEFTAYKEVSV